MLDCVDHGYSPQQKSKPLASFLELLAVLCLFFDVFFESLVHEPVVSIEFGIGEAQMNHGQETAKYLGVHETCFLLVILARLDFHGVVAMKETSTQDFSLPRQESLFDDLGEFEIKGLPVLVVALVTGPKFARETLFGQFGAIQLGPFVPAPVVYINQCLPDVFDGGINDRRVFDAFVGLGVASGDCSNSTSFHCVVFVLILGVSVYKLYFKFAVSLVVVICENSDGMYESIDWM